MHKSLVLAIAAAFTLTACGAYAASHSGDAATSTQTPSGNILTDLNGMSLYTFDNDSAGVSNCDGGCATNWPPLAAPASGSSAGDYSIITRSDGSRQWAFKGAPLYNWINDTNPGDTTGDGVGGVWHLAKP